MPLSIRLSPSYLCSMTKNLSSRALVLLLVASISVHTITSQFADDPTLFGSPQTSPLLTMQSNITSTSSQSGSSDDFSMTDGGSGSESGSDGGLEGSTSEGGMDDSEDGSYSGSSSSSLEYECDCRSVRRVSLMGASDYCLAPNASLSSKCGNVDLREDGGCPIVGAQPCSSKGHVLTNDSFCALDKKDDTYKCVASKNDLEIQKNGKKKKKNSNRRSGSETATSAATVELELTARQVLAIVVCVAAGMMVLV